MKRYLLVNTWPKHPRIWLIQAENEDDAWRRLQAIAEEYFRQPVVARTMLKHSDLIELDDETEFQEIL